MRFALLATILLGTPLLTPSAEAARASASAQRPAPKPPRPQDRLDINSASIEELLRLPGMTPIWAKRIIRFRPYRTKLELLDNGVVTGAVYDRIQDLIIAHRSKR